MGCHISILGLCVLRDFFGMKENNGGFEIDRFVQSISPISAVSNSMLQKRIDNSDEIIQNVFHDLTNFYKRLIKQDLEKSVFTYLSERKSDYLIIDAGNCRYNLLKYSAGGVDRYLTIVYEEKVKKLMDGGYLPAEAEIITLEDMKESVFEFYMDQYIDQILKLYNVEQIILVECRGVPFYINKHQNRIHYFDYERNKKWYRDINRGYRYLRKKLKGCHLIEFPNGVIGDENHKWGLYPLHFIPEYYDYGIEAIETIVGKKTDDEVDTLRNLKEKYEDILKRKYEPVIFQTLKYYRDQENLCARMTKYENYMKNLVIDGWKVYCARAFFKKNGFEYCAFYGLNEISKMYMTLFKEWGIKIDYVIEETRAKQWGDVPCIKRSSLNYPSTQIMIIADLMETEKIRQKLKRMKVPYPVYDVFEII